MILSVFIRIRMYSGGSVPFTKNIKYQFENRKGNIPIVFLYFLVQIAYITFFFNFNEFKGALQCPCLAGIVS